MDEQKNSLATKTMILGIVAIAISELGIPGIILGAIALGSAKNYVAAYGQLEGKAKVGKILGTVGLIVGIVMTVVWLIYGIIGCAAASALSSGAIQSYLN